MQPVVFTRTAMGAVALLATIGACAQPAEPPTAAAATEVAPVDSAAGAGPDTDAIDTSPGTDADQVDTSDTASDAPAGDALPADAATPDIPAPAPQCVTANDCPAMPCQLPVCTAKGTCATAAASDGTACTDGNACTTKDACTAGACAATGQLACDDENACTTDSCNPLSGCLNLPVAASTACDDGDPCTAGDTCDGGACTAGEAVCQCKATIDCGKYEDGNACNGTLYCDKAAGAPYTCKVNPASLVVCAADNDGVCQKNTCVPATGQCKLVTAPPNTPCSDGDLCTQGDFCDSGLCLGGTNTCYCKKDSDCAPAEDGNACNGTLFCNKATSQCQVNPITVVTCKSADDTYCQQNLCNPKTGNCTHKPVHEGKPCDDGNACTPNETCQAGACTAAVNTCECQTDGDCAKKEDGNLCNGTLYCDVKASKCVVNPATVVHCNTDDDPACLRDTCEPKTGKCKEIALPQDGTGCDDGNPCTAASACTTGVCIGGANLCECQKDTDCAKKEDGDLCNGTLFCNPKSNACEVNPATVVACPDAFDETCLTNQCDAKTGGCGMKPAAQGNQCGDDGPCSGGGWCALGQCEGTVAQVCECSKDTDCAQFEDGDLCNGTLYCDKGGEKPTCKVNPKTLVVCKTSADTVCSKSQCIAATGLCVATAQFGPCDDGKACTAGDVCAGGICAGVAKGCNDGDPCTTEKCQEPLGCVSLPLAASGCDDGNACTGDTCVPGKGCSTGYLDTACDDGNPCTAADACKAGVCQGAPNQCDDGNPCTDDACGTGSGCSHKANTLPCTDSDACTNKDTCANSLCQGKVVACDDGNPCTDDFCDKKVGCAASPNAAPCDDGNACTVKDACKSGVCGGNLQCNDNNACTTDACDKGMCAYLANTFECSDGNPCTTGDTCGDGKCSGTAKLDCDDKNLCTMDACDGTTGCAHVATGQACDDGSVCTSNDACANGSCAGKKITCDDGKACTDDACDPAKGCTATDNANPCSDSNACTVNDACAGGKCAPGKPSSCDDGDFCTSDGCDTVSGKCSTAPNPKACDDGKLCTDDACDGKLGCQHTYNKAVCDDGNACTGPDACSFGTCLSGAALVCGDGNLCTDDSCNSKAGCVYAPNAKACDDNNGCTQKDACKSGNCAGILTCDDGNPCTDDSCNFSKGVCENLANGQTCDDGDKCTATSGCQQGNCQGLTAAQCEDNNSCTDNACDKDKGCLFPHNTLPCNTFSCTGEDKCVTGGCKSSGKPLYGQQVYPDLATSDFVADLVATDDGAIGVGTVQTQNTLSSSKSQAWRWGRGGSLLWSKKLNADLSGTQLDGVVRLPDGTYAAVGTWDNALGQDNDQALVVRFDGDGKQLSRFTFGFKTDPGNGKTPAVLDDRGIAIVLSPLTPTEMYVCGWGSTCGSGCNEDVWVARYKLDGSLLAVATHGDPLLAHQHVYACAATGDGKHLLSVGDSDGAAADAKGQVDGEVVVWSLPALAKVKVHRFGSGYYDFLFAATTASDGTVFVGGALPFSTKYARWFLHFDLSGALLWEKSFPNTSANSVSALVALPDGGVVGTGPWGSNGSAQQGFAQRLDWTGHEVKLQLLPSAQVNRSFDSAARDNNGVIWVGGSEFVGYTHDVLITRLDPWLNTQCTQACASKVWAGCDDANPCTTDACGNDCFTMAYAGPCSDGNACSADDLCANGACAGTKSVNCDDQDACTQDSCQVLGGCKHVAYPEGYACAVGKKCTVGVCK